MKPIRVISLWEPWASLAVHGIKKIETRPKPTSWTADKGIYLVHAAKRWTRTQKELCRKDVFYDLLEGIRHAETFIEEETGKLVRIPFFQSTFGHIIGSFEVRECCELYLHHNKVEYANLEKGYQTWHEVREPELSFGDYREGRYAWILQNPRVLKTPIPYKGQQGYYGKFDGDVNKLEFV